MPLSNGVPDNEGARDTESRCMNGTTETQGSDHEGGINAITLSAGPRCPACDVLASKPSESALQPSKLSSVKAQHSTPDFGGVHVHWTWPAIIMNT